MGHPVEATVSRHFPELQSHSLAVPSLETAVHVHTCMYTCIWSQFVLASHKFNQLTDEVAATINNSCISDPCIA